MGIGISTDGVKQRILENEPEKLDEAIREKAESIGVASVASLKGKNQLEQLRDMEEFGSLMSESIQEQRERREHNTRERQRNHKIPFKVGLRRYLENCERKSKADYNRRRIVFSGGGLRKLEDKLKMLSCRVLVKEIPENRNQETIVIPETHTEKYPKNKVVCVGDGVDNVAVGDIVVAEAYAGIEVVSDGEIYRILMDADLLYKVEE